MKKGPVKSPIKVRSKEELIADMQKNKEFQKRMKFVKETFYPALINAAQNIHDASILLEGFTTTVMQSFLARMKDIKMSELNLEPQLDKTSPKFEDNAALLHIFDGLSVFEAKDLIEGMKAEVQQFILDEMRERPLSTLKTKWIDEL